MMEEERKTVFLNVACGTKFIKGDLYVGTTFKPVVQTARGLFTELATSTDERAGVPEFCQAKRYLGFKLSQALVQPPEYMKISATRNPPSWYLPYNATRAVMVRPILGLQNEVCFPQQFDLGADFSGIRTDPEEEEFGSSPDENIRQSSVRSFENMQGKWCQQVMHQGHMPFQIPLFVGHIITPVTVTVPRGTRNVRRRPGVPGDREFDDFMTNTVVYSHSEFRMGTGRAYMGFHFSRHNRAVDFENPQEMKTSIADFIIKQRDEDEENEFLWRGLRVVHLFGLVDKYFEFRRLRLPRRSDGVVVVDRQGPVYGSIFMIHTFEVKGIRHPLNDVPEVYETDDEYSEDSRIFRT